MVAALLALSSSVLWGMADFLGGSLSRRMPTVLVLLLSQGTSLAALLPIALVAGGAGTGAPLAWGAAAGAVGIVAVGLFYRALAIGTMSVVAPIAGVGLMVPVAVGLAAGERPSAAQLAGIVLATAGVVLASTPELRGAGDSARSVWYAVLAAAGFGAVLVLVDRGSEHDVLWTLVSMRTVAVAAVAGAVLARRPPRERLPGRDLARTVLIGGCDLAAIAAYGVASRDGLVSVVAVLASLYPVTTALLARRVYGERLTGSQLGGVAGAMAGVLLLAAG